MGWTIGENSVFNHLTGLATIANKGKSAGKNIGKGDYGAALSDIGAASLYFLDPSVTASTLTAQMAFGSNVFGDMQNLPTTMVGGVVNNLDGYNNKLLQEQMDAALEKQATSYQSALDSYMENSNMVTVNDFTDTRKKIKAALRGGIDSTIYGGRTLGGNAILG
ncbi:MAG: hypothetical protein LBL00_07805 [Endomicrobium sp.]|jgi:hypothetical protein|nr:hypothetical protein [Endomicrobium sp.]